MPTKAELQAELDELKAAAESDTQPEQPDPDSLSKRVEYLERQNKIIRDGFEFIANETRPLYGFGAVALVFDAVYKKLAES